MKIEEKYRVGDTLYSIDWSHGGDGIQTIKSKIVKVTPKLVTLENPNWWSRKSFPKAFLDGEYTRYYTSEVECLKQQCKSNLDNMKTWRGNIAEAKYRNLAIKKKIAKLKAAGKR